MNPDQALWIALLVPSPPESPNAAPPESIAGQRQAIAWWALQFTPRVALVEDAVVLEVVSSVRLFGGELSLRERVREEALGMGCEAVGWAPTALAAIAFARAGEQLGEHEPPTGGLDRLSFRTLAAAAEHAPVLERLGCRVISDVRRLPRGGVSRRFGKELLRALDCAYGFQPEAFEWVVAPENFRARLELPSRVDVAEALLFGARRLLNQMAGWLAARHAGVRAFTLQYKHDFHRPRDVPLWGELSIATAEVSRDVGHFGRLLSERLARVDLGASVEELVLLANIVEPLEEASRSLLPSDSRHGENVTQLIERLSARLGPERVLRAVVRSDYRPEWSQAWKPATEAPARDHPKLPEMPQPTWLLDAPIRLATRKERPLYQGALEVVAGPHRVEAGWWDRQGAASTEASSARRDYFAMRSEHAGLLWVYREIRPRGDDRGSPWYLQGIFG